MHSKIKNKIEKELANFIRALDKTYSLSKISPLLFRKIKEFILRKGKRVRPLLFVIGYLGFTRRAAPRLYKSALSFELLHDFLLIHDDIIDKSATRRGKPSMHKIFDSHLKRFRNTKFNGQDLAIIAGDVMYTLAIDAFLSIKENKERKERALRKFIAAATYTGIGEFIELLSGIKDIDRITKQDVYRIYDYKTAYYTFASPLSCGAILAGAKQNQIDKLHKYGIYLGRAFQIKDDILGVFGEEKKIGKSALTDLQEAKKTILLWYAYNNSTKENKKIAFGDNSDTIFSGWKTSSMLFQIPHHRLIIKRILLKEKVNKTDLLKVRKIIASSGALNYAAGEIGNLLKKAEGVIKSSQMQPKYKKLLTRYSRKVLNL